MPRSVLMVLLSGLLEGAALACPPDLYPRVVAPASGEKDVPLNAYVSVDLSGSDGGLQLYLVEPDGGSSLVPTDIQTIHGGHLKRHRARLLPTNSLLPERTYRVIRSQSAGSQVLAAFRTGVDADLSAPQLSGETLMRIVPYDPSNGAACGVCWPYDNGSVMLAFPPASEASLYQVSDAFGEIATDLTAQTIAYFRCGPTGGVEAPRQDAWFISPGEHQLLLRAVDRAGNLSNGIALNFLAQCINTDGTTLAYCHDAGTFSDWLPPDAGPGQTDAGTDLPPEPSTTGCGCRTVHPATAWGLLLLSAVRRRSPTVGPGGLIGRRPTPPRGS